MHNLYKRMKTLLEGLQDSHLEGEAADPSTSPEKLHAWHDHINPVIRTNVANNPNTPLPTLIKMAGKGEKIDNNPALPLFSLEDPNYLNDIDQEHLEKIINNRQNPGISKQLYYSHPSQWLKQSVLRHTADPELLTHAAQFDDMHHIVGMNHNTPPEVLDHLDKEYGYNNNTGITSYLATNPNTPHHILHRLLDDPNYNRLDNIARNPGLTPELMDKFYNHPTIEDSPEALGIFINNPNLTYDLLKKISDSNILPSDLAYNAYVKLRSAKKLNKRLI